MKIVVIGGNGLIGKKVVNRLRASGNDAVAASPASGVDVDVSVTNVSMDRPDAGAIVSKVGLPGTSEPREAGAQ